jgi:hypothetical protein
MLIFSGEFPGIRSGIRAWRAVGVSLALERALGDTISQRDGDTQFLFDWDTDGKASAAAYPALAE